MYVSKNGIQIYSYLYSPKHVNPYIFVLVFANKYRPKYICIRICLKNGIRIYSYSYSPTNFNPNIFVFVFAKKCWPKYICICIRSWKLYWSPLQGPYDGSSDGQLLPPDSSVSARTSNGKVVSGRSCLPYGISASGRVLGYDCYVAPNSWGNE